LGQAAAPSAAPKPHDDDESAYYVVYSHRAMACDFEFRTPAAADTNLSSAAMAAFEVVDTIESQLTVYNDTSEVSTLNRFAATRPVRVGPELFELFRIAGELHADTHGAYDITSGPLSRVWGFSKRAGRLPEPHEIEAALDLVGWQHVTLDDARSTILFGKVGVEVNFNSIGKGYALDRAVVRAGELADDQSLNFVLHGGRSTLVARGAAAPDDDGWPVGVRHPLRPAERMAQFTLRDQALSTSGSGTQFFRHRGKRYGHLLDPRTGWPAEGLYSATVVAPTATLADALSTALYVMGPQAALDYCDTHPETKALLVVPGQHTGEVELLLANLGDDDVQVSV
jgi:thiamine biosynthesis lipoprotein